MPLLCRGLFAVRHLKLGTGKLIVSQDLVSKAARPPTYRQQHFRTLTPGPAPFPKAQPSRAREKQVQKLPELNFQFSPNDLPPIRKRDQLNARRGTNSKSRLSVTAESQRHEQNPPCPPPRTPQQPVERGASGASLVEPRGRSKPRGHPRSHTSQPRGHPPPQEPSNG